MNRIEEAKKALHMSLGFYSAEGGININWNGKILFFPLSDKSVTAGFGISICHYLICNNVQAILDGKDSFTFSTGDKQEEIPVYKREKHGKSIITLRKDSPRRI